MADFDELGKRLPDDPGPVWDDDRFNNVAICRATYPEDPSLSCLLIRGHGGPHVYDYDDDLGYL